MFNLDTLSNEKINTRLEFPIELDLEEYTQEGLEWRQDKTILEEKLQRSAEDEIELKE